MRHALHGGPLVVSLLVVGCYASNQPGLDGSQPFPDAPQSDTNASDAAVDGDEPGDECMLGGFRRCDGDCGSCASGVRCDPGVHVCIPTSLGNCRFQTDPSNGHVTAACGDGSPCFFDSLADPVSGDRGRCVPEEVCLLPGLADHRCFWSDGSEVTRVPPGEDSCPAFSGGTSCGNPACPGALPGEAQPTCPSTPGEAGGCAGRSDDRGVGLCVLLSPPCTGTDDPVLYETCEMLYTQPCACLRTLPVAPRTMEPFGYYVPRQACQEYASRFPGAIECVFP